MKLPLDMSLARRWCVDVSRPFARGWPAWARRTAWAGAALLLLSPAVPHAAPLLPYADANSIAVPRDGGGIRGEAMDAVDGPDTLTPSRDDSAMDSTSFAPTLLLNPGEEGRQAAAQALTDSPVVRQVLGNTITARDDFLGPGRPTRHWGAPLPETCRRPARRFPSSPPMARRKPPAARPRAVAPPRPRR